VIQRLHEEGYVLVRQRGSHRQFRGPENGALVTVAGRPSATMKPGTLASIRRTTGIEDLR